MADIDVIPGILETDWYEIEQKISLAAPFVSWIQIDFSDESLVPYKTSTEVDKWADIIAKYPHVSFEAHLVVANPQRYVKQLVDAGFKRLIAQVECNDPRHFLELAKFEEVEVGVALDGASELEELEPFLEEVDFVLIMMIEAGPKGQPFLPESLEKIKAVRNNFPDLPIAAEGGITDVTAKSAIDAGATRLVSMSYIFQQPDQMAQTIESLKST